MSRRCEHHEPLVIGDCHHVALVDVVAVTGSSPRTVTTHWGAAVCDRHLFAAVMQAHRVAWLQRARGRADARLEVWPTPTGELAQALAGAPDNWPHSPLTAVAG